MKNDAKKKKKKTWDDAFLKLLCVFIMNLCYCINIFLFGVLEFSSVAIAFLFSKRQKIIPEALPLLVPLLFLSLKRVFR